MIRTRGWNKSVCILCMFCLWICCGSKKDEEEAALFSLEKVLTIDTENSETAGMGLTDISYFDIDSAGKIFIANMKAKENCVFMFNEEGSLLSVFGSRGQGPGEFQSPLELAVSNQNEIFVTDRGRVIVFDNSGRFIKDFRIDSEYQKVIPLNEDRLLVIAVKLNEDLSQSFQVILCSSGFEELKILDNSKIESFKKAAKVNIIPTLLYWEKSDTHVYTGDTEEYEIRVFDFDGVLLRSIKKEYEPVLLSDADKDRYEKQLQKYPPALKESFFIPDAFPPFRDIVAWGDERLLVQSYERPKKGSSMYDIFDTNGVFMGQTELAGYRVKFKGDRIYCLKQKESGYKELVVYRMK